MTKRTSTRKTSSTPAPAEAGALTLADRAYLKFGLPMVRSVHALATVLLFGLVLLADYLIVLFTAVNVLPNIAALVQRGTGVTVDMRIDAVIAGWLLPVLFIIAAVLVGEVFVMRGLWRFAAGRRKALAGWLFRLEHQRRASEGRASLGPAKAQGQRGPKLVAS
jgi:hypothetical protein